MKKFWQQFLNAAEEIGITELEMMMQRSRNFSINIYENEIEKYLLSEDGGYAFRGLYKGKMGYVYTELLNPDLIPDLVNALRENAEVIDSSDIELMNRRPGQPIAVDFRMKDDLNEEEKIQFALELEKAALSHDARIHKVSNSFYAEQESEYRMINSHGLDCEQKDRYYMAYSYLTAKDENDQQTGFAFQLSRNFDDLDPKKIAEEAATEAISHLHPQQIKSGNYPVILENRVMVDLLESFGSIFSADAVQKGLSRMKDKLNKSVASPLISLVDDPTGAYGFIRQPFDSEGIPTASKAIVKDGVLQTYLHNLKTAHKAGVESTGNAHKSSYKGSMGIAPSNFYLVPGQRDLNAMLADMETGLLITEVQGLHSGLNPVSGDFSLAATGFLIDEGLRRQPVHQITIAGNWYQLLHEIQELGGDLWFGIPSGGGHFGAPSVWLTSMSVAGE